MTPTEAALLILLALLMGSFGGVLFLYIQRKIEWDAKRMLMIHIITFLCLCLYTIIGLIPDIPFGLVHKGELYVFVFIYGLNWGSIQSYARSVFAYIVPIGKESQMFALYEITDKGSSWIGPLMVALITNISSIRWAIFYVSSFFLIAMPLLIWGVDLQQGMKQAGRWKTVDLNDPNIAGLNEMDDIPSPKNARIQQGEIGFNGKVINKDTEMSVTSTHADNYHNPKVTITVTSIDEANEMKKNEDIENGTDVNGDAPESRTQLVDDGQNENDNVQDENNDNMNQNGNEDGDGDHNNNIDTDLEAKPIIEVASATDDEDEDENNYDQANDIQKTQPNVQSGSPSVEEIEAEIENLKNSEE
eukprot:CAMPEP_0201573684 /NCGR_PEP_ID=MMETSP0190_2-20130828/17678_1 /ASSEMBLY_ACC=CAM_ASM_000263 /TAXON_ID=37353 /ORGANISM="Rosalina sp." /LENGTH=359 /DNA_ID=CAMNT_0048000937 /DNA_START=246 /DNA_END=1325 /DNA_ORIENTATION=-